MKRLKNPLSVQIYFEVLLQHFEDYIRVPFTLFKKVIPDKKNLPSKNILIDDPSVRT